MLALNTSASSKKLHTGFLAQEVEQACKDLNYSFSGLRVPENETDNYSLAYGSFVPLLVKAVQELSAENKSLKIENNSIKAELNELRSMIESVIASQKSPKE